MFVIARGIRLNPELKSNFKHGIWNKEACTGRNTPYQKLGGAFDEYE